MRTTLTLNDSIHARLVDLAHVRKISFKDAVADVMQIGLETLDRLEREPYRFEIVPHDGGPIKPEYQYAKTSDLLDLEDETDGRPW